MTKGPLCSQIGKIQFSTFYNPLEQSAVRVARDGQGWPAAAPSEQFLGAPGSVS